MKQMITDLQGLNWIIMNKRIEFWDNFSINKVIWIERSIRFWFKIIKNIYKLLKKLCVDYFYMEKEIVGSLINIWCLGVFINGGSLWRKRKSIDIGLNILKKKEESKLVK